MYKFRGLPCRNYVWYVAGDYDNGVIQNSGIQEMCYSQSDALSMFQQMQRYPEFSNLKVDCLIEEVEDIEPDDIWKTVDDGWNDFIYNK